MLPLNFLSGKGLCPRAGRTRCRSIVRLIVTESVTAAALPRQATTPNPIDRCSCTHSDALGAESLAAHTRDRRQLMTSAAIAAAAHWLALPQPAASRGASGQKVGPQLLAAFQEALSAQSHEVNSMNAHTQHKQSATASQKCTRCFIVPIHPEASTCTS
eukprot:GHRQ01026638.1.p1 GENE.GHRQ01026638.1~~GHRQ01026638.1.p1  ORF type:complete len:159 (+),score=13.01 GHRQ01026638.1:651-1127(+)